MNSLTKIPPPQDSTQYEAWREYVGWMELEEARHRLDEEQRRDFMMLWGVVAVVAIIIWLAGPILGVGMIDRLALLKASVIAVAAAAIALTMMIFMSQTVRRREMDDRQRSFDLETRLRKLERTKPNA